MAMEREAEPVRTVTQGVGAHCCLPKTAWPPTEKEITKAVNDLKEGEILILENTRFYDVDSKGTNVKLESKMMLN